MQLVPFRNGHQHHLGDVAGSVSVCYREEGMWHLEFASNAPRLFERQAQSQNQRLLTFALYEPARDRTASCCVPKFGSDKRNALICLDSRLE